MARTYFRDSKGRFAKSPGSAGGATSLNIDTGKSITREAAAAIMFGSVPKRRKAAGGRKARKR